MILLFEFLYCRTHHMQSNQNNGIVSQYSRFDFVCSSLVVTFAKKNERTRPMFRSNAHLELIKIIIWKPTHAPRYKQRNEMIMYLFLMQKNKLCMWISLLSIENLSVRVCAHCNRKKNNKYRFFHLKFIEFPHQFPLVYASKFRL